MGFVLHAVMYKFSCKQLLSMQQACCNLSRYQRLAGICSTHSGPTRLNTAAGSEMFTSIIFICSNNQTSTSYSDSSSARCHRQQADQKAGSVTAPLLTGAMAEADFLQNAIDRVLKSRCCANALQKHGAHKAMLHKMVYAEIGECHLQQMQLCLSGVSITFCVHSLRSL